MFFSKRGLFFLLIMYSLVGYAAPAEDEPGCNGGDFAHEAIPDFEDDSPVDPFESMLEQLRRNLQPAQLSFSDWFWAVEGDRKGAKKKYRLLITLQASLKFLESARETLMQARELGVHLDALHSIKNFVHLSQAALLRMCDIFASDMRLLDRALPEGEKPALEALKDEILGDRAVEMLSPMMRQILSGLNEALVVTNRLLDGDTAPPRTEEISTEHMLSRLRILYSLSQVADPDTASAFAGAEDETLEVVANLVSNAQQAGRQLAEIAIGASKAYRDFGTKPVDSDTYRCVYGAEQKSGHYVGFSVADKAGGMPPEVLRSIFVSGITFREDEGGTGLGLAWVRRVVLSRGGFVEVETQQGSGSRFTVWYPASELVDVVPRPSAPIPDGGKEVVLIDDTRGNLQIMLMFLKARGFNVRGFSTRREALRYLEVNANQVGAVVSDLNTGDDIDMEALLEFTRQHSALYVAICSGDEMGTPPPGVLGTFPKPVHMGEMSEELARRVGKRN
ncbi:MAG: hypothetical protein KDD51_14545 [Bdellovibrionales bacterium]|nr:hypothetical protein [Bdellovibrionales bacterium]